MAANPHAKAWAALIVAILVVLENYFGLSFGPLTSNGVTDVLAIVGAAIVWILPNPRATVSFDRGRSP